MNNRKSYGYQLLTDRSIGEFTSYKKRSRNAFPRDKGLL